MAKNRRPSLLGGLLWTGIGLLLLLHCTGVVAEAWSIAGRYWPVALILFGVGKVVDYFRTGDAVSIRAGEIVGILLLVFAGLILNRTSGLHFNHIIREFPVDVGGLSMKPGEWIGESHTYSEEATYPFRSSAAIRIENSFGLVSVLPGSDNEIRVRLKKIIYGAEAEARGLADRIRVEGSAVEDRESGKGEPTHSFFIRTNRDSSGPSDQRFSTDLEVLVPRKSQVKIVNSFGEVRVAGIQGALDVSTSHRALNVRDCTGPFTISTRYGDSRLTNLAGDLRIESRGPLYLDDIKGNVSIANEYAPVEVFDIDGELSVSVNDGSLRVRKVTKPVTIQARGAEVHVSDLRDRLKITASHKNIAVSDVASDIAIESRYATINLNKVQGNIDIDSNSDLVAADQVEGSFTLKGSASAVRVNGVRGAVDVRTTLKDVVVNGFSGDCSVVNQYGGVSLSPKPPGRGNVSVQNRNGNVDLFLPDGSFTIEASARNGSVESEYPDMAAVQQAGTMLLRSKAGSGESRIKVETEYGNIHIRRARGGATPMLLRIPSLSR